MEKARRKQILKNEEAKNAHISRCMQKNMKDFQDIKVYYGDITSSNLDLIKRLKEEHTEIKKREGADNKQMTDLQQKNKQLSEPLRKANQDLNILSSRIWRTRRPRLIVSSSNIYQLINVPFFSLTNY